MNDAKGGCQEKALIVLGTMATGGVLLALWLMGAEHVRTLGTIFVVSVSVTIVMVGVAVVVRMWRKRDMTGEATTNNHYFHDGTKTVVRERVIDGRAAEGPKLYQLPSQGGGAAFPELLRASYAAGMIAQRGTATGATRGTGGEASYPEWQEVELEPTNLDGWEGDIRG